MYVSALLIHSCYNFSCLAFCLGFASDLYHLFLQRSNPFHGKRCDTNHEILSSQEVGSLKAVGKYVLNKEAFKENSVSGRGLRCIFLFTEEYYWYRTNCFLSIEVIQELFIFPQHDTECS